jgi:hypothetical protein
VPILYFGLALTLSCKLFADGVKFTNIHGWDLEGSGRLFETVLARVQVGTSISHIILINQCFWNRMWRTLTINFIVLVYTLVVHFMLNKKRMARLSTIMRIIGKIEFKKPRKLDISNWVYRYSHPYIRVLGPKKATVYMNEINSPVSLNPRVDSWYQSQTRFNVPIQVSPLKKLDSRKTEAEGDSVFKRDDSIDSEVLDADIPRVFDIESSSRQRNKLISPNFDSHLEDLKKESCLTPKRTGFRLPKKSKLDHPLSIPDQKLEDDISDQYHSNSHFRQDGMILDLAITPQLDQLAKIKPYTHNQAMDNISYEIVPDEIDSSKQRPKTIHENHKLQINSDILTLGIKSFYTNDLNINKIDDRLVHDTVVRGESMKPHDDVKIRKPSDEMKALIEGGLANERSRMFFDTDKDADESRMSDCRAKISDRDHFDGIAKEGTVVLSKIKMIDKYSSGGSAWPQINQG